MYVAPKEAATRLGVALVTLRQWEIKGLIESKKTPGGHRRYNIQSLKRSSYKHHKGQQNIRPNNNTASQENKTVIARNNQGAIYARVSSRKQKDDLQRQKDALLEKYPQHQIFQDIASGLNFKRKGLTRLLDQVQKGNIKEVVVAHRDRLARFGTELIEWIIHQAGATIIILDDSKLSAQQELTEDLMAIVHVFSCRLNGKRRYSTPRSDGKKIQKQAIPRVEQETESRTQSHTRLKKKRRPNSKALAQIPVKTKSSATSSVGMVDEGLPLHV